MGSISQKAKVIQANRGVWKVYLVVAIVAVVAFGVIWYLTHQPVPFH
ncbi:MAG: hypothetical protein JRN51_09255 [Nitrososphaerota archaeon]|nr:hypothetical protein [Nitrososphaerota archaeon]MDG6981279.1 hypothetical protein [Nitrososphaerota archaeon]